MIGGNLEVTIRVKSSDKKNAIGERVVTWADLITIKGWLDYTGGQSDYKHLAKVEDSPHVFVMDYTKLPPEVKSDTSRLLINGTIYQIVYIDNPMELNQLLEIYLKKIGG